MGAMEDPALIPVSEIRTDQFLNLLTLEVTRLCADQRCNGPCGHAHHLWEVCLPPAAYENAWQDFHVDRWVGQELSQAQLRKFQYYFNQACIYVIAALHAILIMSFQTMIGSSLRASSLGKSFELVDAASAPAGL